MANQPADPGFADSTDILKPHRKEKRKKRREKTKKRKKGKIRNKTIAFDTPEKEPTKKLQNFAKAVANRRAIKPQRFCSTEGTTDTLFPKYDLQEMIFGNASSGRKHTREWTLLAVLERFFRTGHTF